MVKKTMGDLGVPAQLRLSNTNTIKHFISEGIPVIVLCRNSETTWHFVVVVGFTEKEFTIADFATGTKCKMDVEIHDNAWKFTHDMDGTPCQNETQLKLMFRIDVYPRTMIILLSPPK